MLTKGNNLSNLIDSGMASASETHNSSKFYVAHIIQDRAEVVFGVPINKSANSDSLSGGI